jgi:hypothetical protein
VEKTGIAELNERTDAADGEVCSKNRDVPGAIEDDVRDCRRWWMGGKCHAWQEKNDSSRTQRNSRACGHLSVSGFGARHDSLKN